MPVSGIEDQWRFFTEDIGDWIRWQLVNVKIDGAKHFIGVVDRFRLSNQKSRGCKPASLIGRVEGVYVGYKPHSRCTVAVLHLTNMTDRSG